jgi:hypothetical protein
VSGPNRKPRQPFHGPRIAAWHIQWSDSGCTSTYRKRADALAELAYFAREGRAATPTVTRTEFCPVPGCDGWGNVWKRGKGGVGRDCDCPSHVPHTDIVETLEGME